MDHDSAQWSDALLMLLDAILGTELQVLIEKYAREMEVYGIIQSADYAKFFVKKRHIYRERAFDRVIEAIALQLALADEDPDALKYQELVCEESQLYDKVMAKYIGSAKDTIRSINQQVTDQNRYTDGELHDWLGSLSESIQKRLPVEI